MRNLAISINWQGELKRQDLFKQVQAADDAGVHSVWVAEAWGRDAFTMLTQLAERTKQMQLGTGIVNVYSRSPGALAQHFATLDELSEGRMIIGLGTSGANVIEHFHGVPFDRPLRRLREYVEVINMLMSGEPLKYQGEIFNLQRGFTLRFSPVRTHIPVFLATLAPKSVRQTAEIADGWLPIWTPLEALPQEIGAFRAAAGKAGREARSLAVRAPGTTVIAKDPERVLRGARGALAFYVARMGVFYYQHVSRLGYAQQAEAIKQAFDAGGSAAGAGAVPVEMSQSMGLVTDSIEQARERLAAQEAAGVDIHPVELVGYDDPAEMQRIYERLAA